MRDRGPYSLHLPLCLFARRPPIPTVSLAGYEPSYFRRRQRNLFLGRQRWYGRGYLRQKDLSTAYNQSIRHIYTGQYQNKLYYYLCMLHNFPSKVKYHTTVLPSGGNLEAPVWPPPSRLPLLAAGTKSIISSYRGAGHRNRGERLSRRTQEARVR